MIQQLEIKNYRGIDQLHIEDLQRVNIFVGQNGIGKTSLLEAAALLATPTVNMHGKLGRWRDMTSATQIIKTAFYGFDYSKPIMVTGVDQSDNWSLTIDTLTEVEANKIIVPHLHSEDTELFMETDDELYGVKHTFKSRGKSTSRSALAFHGDHTHVNHKTGKAVSFGVFFIHARRASSIRETADMVTKIAAMRSQEEDLMATLRSIRPSITRIRVGTVEGRLELFVDSNEGLPLPIGALGDGFNRLLLMLTGVIGTNAKLLIVDEIDSGIHYTAMPTVWQALLNFSRQHNKQIFCTTHNEEMLTATLEGFANDQDELRIYRIARKNGKLLAQKYDYALFRNAESARFPIR